MKRSNQYLFMGLIGLAVAIAATQPALADAKNAVGFPVHAPRPWEWWFQPAASPIQKNIDWLMQFVLWLMAGVVGLVGLLLAIVIVRFRASKNPVASTTTHNTLIEVVWTVVPALLLIVIFVPSLNLIYEQSNYKHSYMTVKVTGHQWYWEYDYPTAKGVDFTSYPVPDNQIKPGQIARLSVDHPLVVPANKKIVFKITSSDVLHSFFIPSLGVQRYAIPGQYWKQWTQIDAPGVYYGECNQICGMNHDNMPIEIVALPMKEFQAWLAEAKADAAQGNVPPVHKYEVLALKAAAQKAASAGTAGIALASAGPADTTR
ncbi:MAG: cytochrome c oxidase subunit II [Acidiphilium sp. 37-67-22]|nr:MAG: cytochrome c oxidase subunit II [Acidiphilium sp. 37-67-22]HQT74050.1 cytochrome c oxidase subunit II [Acidiphilium sp.]